MPSRLFALCNLLGPPRWNHIVRLFPSTRWFKYDREWFVCKQCVNSAGRIWTTLYLQLLASVIFWSPYFYWDLLSSNFLPPTPPPHQVSRSFCNFSMSLWFVIFLYIMQSSASGLILESMFLQISFTYARNSTGSKTLRHGTLPWIVALLLWPFVYDIQWIPFPKRLPSNPRLKPPVS